jgi:hypothetical protein
MRWFWIGVIGAMGTMIALAARRSSRSSVMEHKVEELQDKFRSLDDISTAPATSGNH